MSHPHAHTYRPAAVFSTTRTPWWLRALRFLAVSILIGMAAFGTARLLVDVADFRTLVQTAHDQGMNDGMRICGVKP